MQDTLIPLLIRLINSKAGGAIQTIVGAVIGWLVSLAAAKGIHIPADLVADLTKWLVAAGMVLIPWIVQYLQTLQVHKVQSALGVEPDGHIGPVTIGRAKELSKEEADAQRIA